MNHDGRSQSYQAEHQCDVLRNRLLSCPRDARKEVRGISTSELANACKADRDRTLQDLAILGQTLVRVPHSGGWLVLCGPEQDDWRVGRVCPTSRRSNINKRVSVSHDCSWNCRPPSRYATPRSRIGEREGRDGDRRMEVCCFRNTQVHKPCP
jgi:hypothetical protein